MVDPVDFLKHIMLFYAFALQVMKKSHDARMKLLRLGIFKEVEVLIDISEGTACTRCSASDFKWKNVNKNFNGA